MITENVWLYQTSSFSKFTMDGHSGILRIKPGETLDYETTPTHFLTVVAKVRYCCPSQVTLDMHSYSRVRPLGFSSTPLSYLNGCGVTDKHMLLKVITTLCLEILFFKTAGQDFNGLKSTSVPLWTWNIACCRERQHRTNLPVVKFYKSFIMAKQLNHIPTVSQCDQNRSVAKSWRHCPQYQQSVILPFSLTAWLRAIFFWAQLP